MGGSNPKESSRLSNSFPWYIILEKKKLAFEYNFPHCGILENSDFFSLNKFLKKFKPAPF